MNTFIQQGHIKLLKSDNIYNDLYFKLIIFFYKLIFIFFIYHIYQRRKMYHCFNKIRSSAVVLSIDNNKHQVSILEWFLENHVTLKTEAMMLKFSFASQE